MIKYPLLFPSFSHGSTDIIDYPLFTLKTHLFSFLGIKMMPTNIRKSILIFSSIFHMRHDLFFLNKYNYYIFNNIFFSCILHKIWITYPITAKLYLTFYHTPLHITSNFLENNYNFFYKIVILNLTNVILFYGLSNNIDLFLNNKLGEYWWVATVLGHIIISEYKFFSSFNEKKRKTIEVQKSTKPKEVKLKVL